MERNMPGTGSKTWAKAPRPPRVVAVAFQVHPQRSAVLLDAERRVHVHRQPRLQLSHREIAEDAAAIEAESVTKRQREPEGRHFRTSCEERREQFLRLYIEALDDLPA